ncbi:hypothetical protein L0666_11965 [Octadecabacter sp. CECT 8868]|uniref:hypothetical protein n=1 Tax=Octadecabacter algicola TaxID=2909342 RepID=UPI001F33B669|nr:hypothetical protein [Octadecabacter algicola]MCF2905705.1 hypothetical protein [Octadecabacter algicola]
MTEQSQETACRRMAYWLLVVLLAFDVLLIVLSVIWRNPDQLAGKSAFALGPPWSIPSIYIYLKWVVASLVLAIAARKHGEKWLGLAALVFLILLIDDSGEIHESIGRAIGPLLPFENAYYLRAQDYASLIGMALLAFLVFGTLALSHQSSPPKARIWPRRLVYLILSLAFFGVVMDLLHGIVRQSGRGGSWNLLEVVAILEDGGEMMVASVLLVVAVFMSRLPKEIVQT